MNPFGAIFPGQGSQHPGMGQFLDDNFEVARRLFDEASDVLHFNCRQLCFSGSEQDLQLTENTQPMLVLVSVASYEVLKSVCGFEAQAFAGHSVGEYSALVCSGSIKFADAVRAVRTRGAEMQKASPQGMGGMCAVLGLSDEQVRELCRWVENESGLKPLSPANFNAPGQVVVSGRQTAIDWMIANFKKDLLFANSSVRAKFIPLKVSAPFHCQLMEPAEAKMREVLNDIPFRDITAPVVQNLTARANREGAELREQLIRQVTAPVLWTQCMRELQALNISRFVESGPGRVLSGLAKKIDGEKINVLNFNSLDDLKTIGAELKAYSFNA